MDKGYMAGLIEGEGCFRVQTAGTKYMPSMQINLRDDDGCIIKDMRRTLQVKAKATIRKSRRDVNPSLELRLRSVSDCLKLINFLDDNPFIGRKRAEYEIWKQLIYYCQRNFHTGKEPLEVRNRKKAYMKECYDELRRLKQYKKPQIKITQNKISKS